MADFIRIKNNDNVLVVIKAFTKGSTISFEGSEIVLADDIPRGHKIALKDISEGGDVIKYGYPIGKAKTAIKKGEWVHKHNMGTKLSAQEQYTYNPVESTLEETEPETFMGYIRDDGRAAVRNEIWIIPGVNCVGDIASHLVRKSRDIIEKYGLDGIQTLNHPYGCSQLGDDHERTVKILAALANHPNAGGVLVIGLGCENNVQPEFKKAIKKACGDSYSEDRFRYMICQEVEDEHETGLALIEELAKNASRYKRRPVPVSKLVVGMKCGGSDGLSGITANPLAGRIGDMIISRGGSSILTEVPEMFGAEDILLNRCVSKDVFDSAAAMLNHFKEYFLSHGQPVYENPAPGNYEGGISSLEDKSLGCVQKGGFAPVVDVIGYGDQVRKTGLTLLSGPGNDSVSATNLAAAGAHVIFFTTGRGNPFCTVVPTVKISSNSDGYSKKGNWIDFNAGIIAENKSIDEAAEELYKKTLAIVSGEKTKGEINGFMQIGILKSGVTL